MIQAAKTATTCGDRAPRDTAQIAAMAEQPWQEEAQGPGEELDSQGPVHPGARRGVLDVHAILGNQRQEQD